MENRFEKSKKPWPTKDAMNQVYENKLWGGEDYDFYSGEGSHHLEIVKPYINVVASFFKSFKNPISVCDLGCGDFNVGKELVTYTSKYIGIDIVPSLITRNTLMFKQNNLEFKCLDISKGDLPKVDCIILRQVLQHLSNKEIENIVNKLYDFKYVILTEHIPKETYIPNKDIISGQGIRIKKKSGVNLLRSPFNFKIKSSNELTSYNLENDKGSIVTTLYIVF